MASQYPGQIDNANSLPIVIDNVTAIKASVLNKLREAIISIENELGTKPASIYGSVKARLNAIEETINGLQIISLSGDLGGTVSSPSVIRLQGNPISSSTPDMGDALIWNGLTWEPQSINLFVSTFEPPLGLTITSTKFYAVNQSVTPSFTVSYSKTPTQVLLLDSEGNPSEDKSATPTSFSANNIYTKTTYGSSVTFTFTVNKADEIVTEEYIIKWVSKIYFGFADDIQGIETYADLIQNDLSGELSDSFIREFSGSSGNLQYIWFAYPTSLGQPTFAINNTIEDFVLIDSNIQITNLYGYIETYSLYRSINHNLGAVTVNAF